MWKGVVWQASLGAVLRAWLGSLRHGRQVWARNGKVRSGDARQAPAWHGSVWHGRRVKARFGLARPATAWQARRGASQCVRLRHGRQGEARHFKLRHSAARRGLAGEARSGAARMGAARRGKAWQAWQGTARHGAARRDKAGRDWNSKAGIVGASRGSFHLSTTEDYMSTKQMAIQWKPGSCFAIDAETAHAEIERIRTQHGGELTAGDVVAEAKDKANPLHDAFEWNDRKAAHEHRLEVARRMIRSIAIIREEAKGESPQRVYEVVRVKVEEQKPRNVYKTTEEIMADPETRAELLSRALRELVAIRAKYRHLQELAIVFRSVEEVLETVEA